MAHRVPARLTAAEGRSFAFTVGSALLVLGAILWWRGHLPVAFGVIPVAVVLFLAGLMLPARLGPVYRAWMRFGLLLSRVTMPIFMAFVYFLVITPIGLLRRALGGNALRGPVAEGESYWLSRDRGRSASMERQF
ncbi:MAG: hypothetical protein ACRENI_09305 [Gemmatimonadaceae bacterium]